METLLNTPYIIRIIAALAAILILNRIFKNLIGAVAGGTLLLALWCGHGFTDISTITFSRLTSGKNIMLTIVIFQVIWLSSIMEKTGVMKDLVTLARKNFSQRTGFAVLPAIIGMLPMPGGALFSAPMVDDMGSNRIAEPLLKSKINYWFRHVWEYWWPLYPGVLLTLDITGLAPGRLILIQIGLSFFAIWGGYFFLLRKIPPADNKEKQFSSRFMVEAIILTAPIITVIVSYIVITIFIPSISILSNYAPMIIGLCLAITTALIQKQPGSKEIISIFTSINTVKLVILVIFIGIYGAFIETPLPDGNYIMSYVREELTGNNIPIIFIIMIIPFISGLSTGIAVGFVGASFPIVMNLLGTAPAQSEIMSYTVIAYSFGFAGMMLSPVHVCHIVTVEYFKTSLYKSMLSMIKPSMVILAGGLLIGYTVKYL